MQARIYQPARTAMQSGTAKTHHWVLEYAPDSARSVDPLIEMLQNQSVTASARGFAAVALGIVADKEELPWNAKISVNINYRANTPTLTDPAEGTGILDIL